jgi:hypothetical protein
VKLGYGHLEINARKALMKKNKIAITLVLSITAAFLFIPLSECQSESILSERSIRESQLVFLLDPGPDACAILKGNMAYEEEISNDFNFFSFGRISSFYSLLKFFFIPKETGVQPQAISAEQPARSPPFLLSPPTLTTDFQKDRLPG